jgi:Protein-tyrosine-phosphatase
MPRTRPLILLVCTGNVCRSPAAEYLLKSELTELGIDVASAGVEAIPDQPIDPLYATLLQQRGIDTSDFRSRWLTASMPLAADLILTATSAHRAAVTRMLPPVLHRTLTIKQLARYTPQIVNSAPPFDAASRIDWILGELPRARSLSLREGSDSIEDPIGKSQRTYETVFAEIEKATGQIASLFT